MTNKDMELKAYKKLAAIYDSMFHRVRDKARNCVQYRKDNHDEVMKELENIANPAKWDYSGLLSNEDKAVLEMLEYLLNDDMVELTKYKAWQPQQM